MSDLLGLALGGVRAARSALETVGDNVANATTPGYVRRVAQLGSLIPGGANSPFERDPVAAGGVEVRGIARAVDLIRQDSLRRAEGDVAMLEAADRWLTLIQSSLTGPASIEAPLGEFFAGLSDLASDPTSVAVRGTVLAQAESLAGRFNAAAGELDRLKADLAVDARVEADRLTSLADALADVNAQLRRATVGGGAAAGLADKRDALLAQIATVAAIDVRLDGRGMATVRIGDSGGPVLVEGARNEAARVIPSPEGGFALALGPDGGEVRGTLLGGSLLGLSVARQKLVETGARLDQLANRLAGDINAAHALGVDQNGQPGGAIFSTIRMVVALAAGNGGDARISATLADGATPPALRLRFNGSTGEWTLSLADGSSPVTGTLPLTLEGVTVEGIGSPRGGDVFVLTPATGARGIGVRPLTPEALATAPRWLADRAPGNLGGAVPEIRIGPAIDPPPVPPLEPPFAVTVAAGGTLELRDGLAVLVATGAAGEWLSGEGFEIRVSGPLVEGDAYRIRENDVGGGGNANALLLLAVRDSGGAAGTIEEGLDRMVAAISVPLAETRAREAAAKGNRDAAAEAVAAAAGVDLNREAADMLRFQQAYQANARLIQTARETFEAILRSSAA